MKNAKKPTRRQKILMDRLRLDPADYLIVSENDDQLELMSKHTGKIKVKTIPYSLSQEVNRIWTQR